MDFGQCTGGNWSPVQGYDSNRLAGMHTYPENFRALALTVLAGEATRRKKNYQGSEIRTGPGLHLAFGNLRTLGVQIHSVRTQTIQKSKFYLV